MTTHLGDIITMELKWKSTLICSFLLAAFILSCHAQNNPCQVNRCQNGGSCREAILAPYYVCLCVDNFIGQHCQTRFREKNCGANSYTESGNITSPNFPNSYGYNERCLYLVRIPEAQNITFTFTTFDTELFKDELYIGVGPEFVEGLHELVKPLPEGIQNYQGQLNIAPITYQTNQLTLFWETDRNIFHTGFHISYTRDTDPCWQNDCGNGQCIQVNSEEYTCRCTVGWSGRLCNNGAILVRQTAISLISGNPLYEGRDRHRFTFNLAVYPDTSASNYNVIGSSLWQVNLFLSNQQNGQGERISYTSTQLSSEQMSTSWLPPNTMNILNIQTFLDLSQITCQEMKFVCASIDRGIAPSVNFYMQGTPNNASLVGCTPVSCTGVRIQTTELVWKTQNALREGFESQNVQFDVRMTPDSQSGSVFGTSLWVVRLYGNTRSDGLGERVQEETIILTPPNSQRAVQVGVTTVFSDITTVRNMLQLTCAQTPYICIEVQKNPNSDPDFTFSGDLIDCVELPCRGVNIINTILEIETGNPLVERTDRHGMRFDLRIEPDPNGGAAVGTDLWGVALYASSGSSTTRVSPTVNVQLTSSQSGTSLRPPLFARIQDMEANLNLQGVLCRQLVQVCAVLSKNPVANPSFTFETDANDPALTDCINIECAGVTITNLNLGFLTGNQFLYGDQSHDFSIFFTGLVDSTGASISGTNLWEMSAYLSTDADGNGQRLAETLFALTDAQRRMAATAGATLTFNSLAGNMDLSGITSCAQFSYFCVDLRKGGSPSPDFTLSDTVRHCIRATCDAFNPCVSNPCSNGGTCTGSGDTYSCTCPPGFQGPRCSQEVDFCARDNIFCLNGGTCLNRVDTFFCQCLLGWKGTYCENVDLGVQLSSTDLSISYGTLIERQQSSLNLNILIQSLPTSQNIAGTGLWKLEVFSNTQPDGTGDTIIQQTLTLDPQRASIPLSAGGTGAFNFVPASIDMSGYTCDSVPYLCVRVLKGDNPSPDFVLTGDNVDCVSSQCKGVEVTRVTYDINSGRELLIGEAAHTVNFDLSAFANSAGASIAGNDLWRVVLYTSTQIDGKGQTGAQSDAILISGQEDRSLLAGQQLSITNAQAQLNLQQLTCEQSDTENPDIKVTHLCVRLERNPGSTPAYTLTGIPNDDALTYCERVSCQTPSPCESVQCQNGGTCREISSDFFCDCPPLWVGTVCDQRVNFCANIICANGGTCINLATTYQCQCATGWSGIRCGNQDAVIITSLQAIAQGYLGEGKTNPLTFDVTFSSDPRGSSISGTDLWRLIVYSNTQPDGSGTSVTQSLIEFNNQGQSSFPLPAGGSVFLNDLSANLDLRGQTCNQFPYICIELQKGTNADPDFVLNGQLVRCVPIECRGVQITNSGISVTSANTPLNERSNYNLVTFDLTMTSSSNGGSISGTNLWDVTTFLNSQPDGSGPEVGRNQVSLNFQQGSTGVPAGATVTIPGLQATLDLTNRRCSDDIQYFCTQIQRSASASTAFTINPAIQTSCEPIVCKGVEVTNVEASINSGTPIRVGRDQTINFNLRTSSNPSGSSVSGQNLWLVDVFTNTQRDGGGARYAQSSATFTSGLGVNTPLQAGIDMVLNNGVAQLDLSTVQSCANQVPYVCFTLRRNPISNPVYTLTGFPTSDTLTECVEVLCEEPSPCENNICQNGATCFENVVGYTCSCDIGWIGRYCNIVSPCEPTNPCQYGGRCLSSGTGTYTCQCQDQYSGTNCEIAPDPCLNLPCQNGGTCTRQGTGSQYFCTCRDSYTGANCENRDGPCSSDPCQNGGTCFNSADGFTFICICQTGWKGFACQFPAPCDPRLPNPCQNGGICNDPADGSVYTCTCPIDYQGNNCQYPNPCHSNPCQNGGTCQSDSIGSIFVCTCPNFYYGVNCQLRDPCYSSPCRNGATCSRTGDDSYQCVCAYGWLGTLCDIDDPCLPNPCQNAANCAISQDYRAFTCNCQQPYIGLYCQSIDRCIPDPCLNGGICSTSPNGALHICQCPQEWKGYNCQDPNYCRSQPCQNGGVCVINADGTGYQCNCGSGYSGDNCQNRDPCNSSPCLNGGACLESSDLQSFLCNCPTTPIRYYGNRCETPDPCASNPCFNGASCNTINSGLSYQCQCLPSFYGDRCDIYDPCSSAPCFNGGICESTPGGDYTCRCAPGFSGSNCEIAESCNPSPCLNGGTCQPFPGSTRGYTCLCNTGYYGTQCGSIDLCSFQPCKNGGTCTFDAGSAAFTCTCPPGFYGAECTETDPCSSVNNPCQNGGLCIADATIQEGYRCVCDRGYFGPNCGTVCQGFACANGQCIHGGIACDGIQHCTDGSDESECSILCGVRCDAGTKCLNASKECDGFQDCTDNMDELGCDSMCKPNPCYNGGLCTEVLDDNNAPDFECMCTQGFCGRDCRETSGEGVNCVNQPPVFELPNGLNLIYPEDTATGTPLIQLQASDPDNDTLTFSLYDSVAQSLFTIDTRTGQLYLKTTLDRETRERYTYVVAVSDGRNTVTQEGTFTAQDINDNAPTFLNLPHTVRIPENAAFGRDVYTVMATDPDTSAGGLVTYSIVNSSVPFSISSPFTGQILVSGTLDYETQREYQLFINSKDLGVPSFNTTEILTVIVEDIQDSGPMFINEPYDTSFEEGTLIGTPVVTVVAVDGDTVNQNTIIYDIITGNEGGYFSLNQNNGEITVVKELDKDSPNFPEEITFTIRATEIGPIGEADLTEDYTSFTIIVTDIQDEPPTFNSPFYIVTVSEEQLPGFRLPLDIKVNDGDTVIEQAFSVRVEPSNVPFVITPTTALGEATLQVNLRQQLDFETSESHDFQIVATEETGSNPLTGSTTVRVIVLDANDNDPIFEGPIGAVDINEGVVEGFEVVMVTANDLDTLDVNTEIRYSIIAGDTDNLFRIDEVTGIISVNVAELDYEEITSSQYILTLEARNTADPVLPARGSTQTSITINILNLNDNAPVFNPADYTIPISEVTEPGLTIGRIVATDPDPGPAGDVLYYIVSGNDGTFELDPNTGNIQLIGTLDRETKASYLLTVQAQDQGNPVLSTRTTVQIDVRDFNDNDPQWSPQSYAVNIREGQPADTFLIQVSATDADTGVNSELVYEINPANDCFQINSETGQITTTKPLDREESAEHILSVTVRDRGNPQRSASRPATVTVTVTDVNDSPPAFLETEYVYEILENLQTGTEVGLLTATDPDTTGTLRFEFDPILSDFNVIANTGLILTNRPLDRERQANYTTIARVRDGLRVDTVQVTIIVLDANDSPPTFNASEYTVSVYENSPVPTEVIRLVATDDDQGAFGRVSYRFVGGSSSHGPFTIINPTNGIITTSTQLNYEDQQTYTLYIEARDGGAGGDQLSGTTSVVVNVLDVNDNGPQFPDISYNQTVPEDVDENVVIIQIIANDLDSADTGPAMYRIIQGNANGMFVIDPLTGEIRRGAIPLDRETKDSYFLIVETYNDGVENVPTDTAIVTINIEDVNDEVPTFSQAVYTRPDFPEDSDIGTTVIIISANDRDLGAAGEVRYDIIGGNDQGIFTIDPDTGLVTLVTELPKVELISTYNLTIRAMDQAAPNHFSLTDVVINIRPALEEVPQFTESRYVANVTENADFGTLIVKVLASLPDGSFISYTIDENVNPTIFDLFSLHPNSGEITVEGSIDREAGSFYTFTVLAYNGGSVPGSAAVWVHVLDENDNAPVFVLRPNERMPVEENLPAGTVVAEFEATDADEGRNAQVVYNITSGDSEGHFRIEITSDGKGQVVTTTPLDRESIDTYNLEITASDLGVPVQSSSITFEVVVTDTNDNPPEFANSSFTGISTEGTLSNTPVVTVIVDDLDIPSSNNLEFVIISGDPDGVFTIDSRGEIRQTGQLDRETQAFYNLTILVRDNSYDSSYQTTTFAYITISDANDNQPEFVGVPYSANVTEGPDSNNQVVVIVTAEDGDTGVNGEVIYTIIRGNSGGEFAINSTTGVISTITDLDREREDMYTLVVIAVDQADREEDRKTSTATITITVDDINDTPPEFEKPYNGPYVISEGVPNSYIGTFVAIDLDGDGTGITYNVTGEYSDLFIIDPETGVLTLRPDQVLDFEISTGFNITVIAQDNGKPPLTGITIIEIVVDNVNDNTPQFVGTPYETLVNENTTGGEVIFVVNATDLDQGGSGDLRFEIIGGNSGGMFRIDPVTGEVFLEGLLNYDAINEYELLISVRDSPDDLDNSLSVNTVLTIGVIDSLDAPPRFPGDGAFFGSVLEHSSRGTPVDMVEPIQGIDDDSVTPLTYSIAGTGSQIFSIDTGTGILRVSEGTRLDREIQDMHTFIVIATDVKGRSATGTVTVTVLDINDQPPSFLHAVYNFTIPENSQGGYSVGQVFATDMDSTPSTLQYTIIGGTDGNFDIDADTGEITVSNGASLNRELKAEYIVQLTVSDQGTPPLSGNGIVFIGLTDINDDAPYFPPDMLQIVETIAENSPINTVVTQVTALDRDIDAEIEYNIASVEALGPNGDELMLTVDDNIRSWFMINSETGDIYVSGGLDRETAVTVRLEISATDNAVSGLSGVTSDPNAQVTIHITDVNDNDPMFQPEGIQFILVQLQEGSPRGTIVVDVDAIDLDEGVNGQINFYFGDLEHDVFDLDQGSGVITVRNPIDREELPWVNFTIGAVDGGGRIKLIPIYVEITDINDNNPMFDQEQFTGSVSETAVIDTEVLIVTATDLDVGVNGNLTYTISGGNIGGAFRIDSLTGVIYVNQQLDKETRSQYTLTVKATDNTGGVATDRRESSVEVIIDILDSNEFAPVVDPEISVTVPEGQPPDTLVGVIDAVDPDDPNQELIFIIIGTEPEDGGGLIYINETTGEIFTKEELDRDNSTYGDTIIINVQVSDGGSPTMVSNTTITVNIGDINDNTPFFPDGPYMREVSEVAPVGSPVIVILANDPDLNSQLTYSIVGGNANNTFFIHPETGEIIITKPLDYETQSIYNLIIQVEDEGGFKSTTTLQIDISDANDQGPTFVFDVYNFEVQENRPEFHEVGEIEAIDNDRNAVIKYYIISGNEEDKFTIDRQTGAILVAGDLDREMRDDYTLIVEARDDTNAQYKDQAFVFIDITDENDITPTFPSDEYTKRLQEMTDVDSIVIVLPAKDGDLGENGRITYHIVSGNIGDTFKIDESSGEITVGKAITSLNPPVYEFNLTIEARDQGNPSLVGVTNVLITIGDTNDRAPTFINPAKGEILYLPENEEVGYNISRVIAIDGDIGMNGEVTYSIDEDNMLFYIDAITGVLYANFSADRETKDEYTVILLASDGGEPPRRTHHEVTIRITDKDDNLPYFGRLDPQEPTPQDLEVKEHSNTSTVVGAVIPAIDDDLDDNAIIYYCIVEGNENNQFAIDKDSGNITVTGDLDRETTPFITLLVLATNDSACNSTGPYDPRASNNLKEVKIHLTDINDNGPLFPQTIYVTSVPLDAEVGELIAETIATDPDVGSANNIQYAITISDFIINGKTESAEGVFFIEKESGRILTNKLLTNYVGGYFDLTVMATDVETGKTATALVRIYVLDNNQRVVVVIDAELNRVKELESELVDLLENITGGIVIVDEITYYTDKNGNTHDDQTMMIIHVIDRETNEIIPADDILIVIDDNYRTIEELLIKYGVINFYPVLGGRGAAGLAILEWALLAIALLLFLGALIFIIILCCLRRRLLKKIHGGGFITGAHKDVSKLEEGAANGSAVKRNVSNANSFSGSNPLWLGKEGEGDWPDSISLIGRREYEAQERSMDFFEDDIEEAHEAIIMTSLVSEKAMMDADTASARHLNGGLYHSGQASMMHVDGRKPADPVMSRYIDVSNLGGSGTHYDGSSNMQSFKGSGTHYDGSSGLQSFQGSGSFNRQGNLTEEKAFEIRQMLNEQREENMAQRGQLRELGSLLTDYSSPDYHQSSGPTSVHIKHRPDDSDSDDEELAQAIAIAHYKEQIDFDNNLTPITEMTEDSHSQSSITSASLASERSGGRRALDRNLAASPYRKDYGDPMSFTTTSTIEENFQKAEIVTGDKRPSQKAYASKRSQSKPYSGSAVPRMIPVPEETNEETTLLIRDEDALSQGSSADGMTYTYHVNPDGVDQNSLGSNHLSSAHTTDEELGTGMGLSDDFDDGDYLKKETHVRRSKTTSTTLSNGGPYHYFDMSDEESQL